MNTLRALIYADARSLVNQLKSIRRSPVRAIMWALFGLLVVGGIVFRFVRAAHHESFGFQTLGPRVVCDGIVCFIVIGLGISLALGSRFAGLFAHAAEARFIIGSPGHSVRRDDVCPGTRHLRERCEPRLRTAVGRGHLSAGRPRRRERSCAIC